MWHMLLNTVVPTWMSSGNAGFVWTGSQLQCHNAIREVKTHSQPIFCACVRAFVSTSFLFILSSRFNIIEHSGLLYSFQRHLKFYSSTIWFWNRVLHTHQN